jgi:hypothetical protein
MNLFTGNSPYYHLLKYLLFLLKHSVFKYIRISKFCTGCISKPNQATFVIRNTKQLINAFTLIARKISDNITLTLFRVWVQTWMLHYIFTPMSITWQCCGLWRCLVSWIVTTISKKGLFFRNFPFNPEAGSNKYIRRDCDRQCWAVPWYKHHITI